jgi:hypothetical protein
MKRCTIGVPSGVKSSAMACLFFSNELLTLQMDAKLCESPQAVDADHVLWLRSSVSIPLVLAMAVTLEQPPT